MTTTTTSPSLTAFTATLDTINHITALVAQVRPGWDPALVKIVLDSHAAHVNAPDLMVAAIRCAADERMPYPKSIGWRGPHWDGLATVPPDVAPSARCGVCGKPEPLCWSVRPGRDDDHQFEPTTPTTGRLLR